VSSKRGRRAGPLLESTGSLAEKDPFARAKLASGAQPASLSGESMSPLMHPEASLAQYVARPPTSSSAQPRGPGGTAPSIFARPLRLKS
jgi:hypothetical protein